MKKKDVLALAPKYDLPIGEIENVVKSHTVLFISGLSTLLPLFLESDFFANFAIWKSKAKIKL